MNKLNNLNKMPGMSLEYIEWVESFFICTPFIFHNSFSSDMCLFFRTFKFLSGLFSGLLKVLDTPSEFPVDVSTLHVTSPVSEITDLHEEIR